MAKISKKTVDDLKQQLSKNEDKKNKLLSLIEKNQSKLDKMTEQINTVGITREMYDTIDQNKLLNYFDNDEQKLDNYYWNVLCKHESLIGQIKQNNNKLKDLIRIISNLNEKITQGQEDEISLSKIPKVILEFCEQWKTRMIFYFIQKHDNSKSDMFRYRTNDYIKETFEYEAKNLGIQICVKVWDKCGEIVDASNLHLGDDGSINGYVIGKRGSAKVESIVAGGYNIQKEHFRVLVK